MTKAADRVFLDASVLIAATLSSSGGSFYLLTHLRDRFDFHTNDYVFEEVTTVLGKKFPDRSDLRSKLFLLLGWVPIRIVPDASNEAVQLLAGLINKEDAPILASALSRSSYLLTLDQDFFSEPVLIFSKSKGLLIVKPKEFIERHRH
jgi:predicted nucleic acid-binding protein